MFAEGGEHIVKAGTLPQEAIDALRTYAEYIDKSYYNDSNAAQVKAILVSANENYKDENFEMVGKQFAELAKILGH